MCTAALAYAATAVATVGGAVASADQARRAAHAAMQPPPPAPPPTAEAIINPETAMDPNALNVATRRKLKVDLASPSGANVGAGLMVPAGS